MFGKKKIIKLEKELVILAGRVEHVLKLESSLNSRMDYLVSIIGTINQNQAITEFRKLKQKKLNKDELWLEMESYFDLDRKIKNK